MPILIFFFIFASEIFPNNKLISNFMRIRLLVFMNDSARKADNHVYERIIEWDNSIVFPFESTFKTMKCLYGNACVVIIEMY